MDETIPAGASEERGMAQAEVPPLAPPIVPPVAQSVGVPATAVAEAAAAEPTVPAEAASAAVEPPAASSGTPETSTRPGSQLLIAAVIAAALAGGTVGFGGGYLGASLAGGSQPLPISSPGIVTVNNPDAVGETTAIAARVLPSVVTLDVTGRTAAGSGSGVAISPELIITNAHVVSLDGQRGTPSIRVTTSDGRLLDATIVGIDPIYDIAVIRAVGAGLTPIEFADSTTLNVGDTAVAIGAPLGLSNSVTTGIVSALNRSIRIASSAAPDAPPSGKGDEEDAPFEFRFPGQESGSTQPISIAVIQTDAAINPGNSGGALVDSQGRLIGINVAIATTGDSDVAGSIGLGFAIPAHIAHRVASELIEHGQATHGLIGVNVLPASTVTGTTVAGAYITAVVPGSPGETAGLATGDVVTAFNGVPITSANDLTAQARAVAAGSTATLTYVREGRSHTIEITLGALAL